MNYIRHLNAFFNYIKNDKRLASSHVSLYMALFQYWNFNRFENPFPIYRENILQLSKIGSKNTYHKCIKELHQAKYIFYHAAASKYQPVKISMIRLDKKEEKKSEQLDLFSTENGTYVCPKNDTVQVPNLTNTSTDFDTTQVPKAGRSIKQRNYKQINNELNTPTEIFKKNEKLNNAVNGLAHVSKLGHNNETIRSPELGDVQTFFSMNSFPIEEAQKFFYYNQSKNWMLTETIPIIDWKPLAHKWMLNTNSNKQNQNGKSHTSQHDISSGNDKDYSEPL